MGLFCANVHFQTDDRQAVEQAMTGVVDDLEVLDAANGWVSAYAPGFLHQDESDFERLVANGSERVGCRTSAFWVYDSDIARYWLHDRGKICDRYDSWPGYFDDAPPQPTGGNPAAVLPFCRPDTDIELIRRVLQSESAFADDVVTGLAGLFGIDSERAVQDHRNSSSGASTRGRSPDLSAAIDAVQPDPSILSPSEHDAGPTAIAMVRAASAGDTETLRSLLAETTDVDERAPTALPGAEALAGIGLTFPGAAPEVLLSPLVAAVANSQSESVAVLLEAGADPNQVDEIYQSPVFAACGSGDPESLRLLLDHGGDPTARDATGRTPLQALQLARSTLEAVAQTQATLESLGMAVPDELEDLASAIMPTEGWNACEEILRQTGAAS